MTIFFETLRHLLLSLIILLYAATVQAHTGDGPHNGLMHGFSHPLSGWDHFLAMIAVGLWSVQISLKNNVKKDTDVIWLLPAIFVVIMGLGGLLGMISLPFVFAEHGIALSLLISGFLIASAVQLPLIVSALLIALFAVCHGYAHGMEMPDSTSVLSYATGFMLATALLHVCGIGLALLAYNFKHEQWLRIAGIMVALPGVAMLINVVG